MKRYLLSLVALLTVFTVQSEAKTYSVVFNSYSDNMTPSIIEYATDHIVKDTTNMSKVTRQSGVGLKCGTASVKGALTVLLNEPLRFTSVTVYAASYSHKNDTAATKGISVMGKEILWKAGSRTTMQAYTVNVDVETDQITVSSLVDGYNRFYISGLEFEATPVEAGNAKLDFPYAYKFASMEYDEEQAAADEETFTLSAQDASAEGISLKMKSGAYFKVSPNTLPKDGGEFTISYTCSVVNYYLNDTLELLAQGINGKKVRYTMLVKGNVYKYVPQKVDSTGMVISPYIGSYYDKVDGLRDSVLKSEIAKIINCGVRYRYGSGTRKTWQGFYYTDRDSETNMVLDMYSNEQHYYDPANPTASVSGFDIEHMLPKSWWGGTVNAAYKDLYHLVPGNSSANRSKSNHAPGTPTDSSFYNGSFVTGADMVHGLDRAFCPADEYKGDFARAYFYIACCYGDELTWVTSGEAAQAMTNKSWEEFQPWLRDLLLEWHRMDPVSEKEKNRAIEVNKIQGNRNPFIDYPELVEYIWGNKKGESVSFSTLTPSFDIVPTALEVTDSDASLTLKVLRDGKLLIQQGDHVYTILGTLIE